MYAVEDLQPSTVGDLLRDRRQQLGLSLEEIASRTRIRRLYLEALEKNRFETLPGEAYLSGFLRSYAGVLGLEAGSVLRQWREQTVVAATGRKDEASPAALPVVVAVSPVRRRAPVLLFFLAVLLIAAGISRVSFDRRSGAEVNIPTRPPTVPSARAMHVQLPSDGLAADTDTNKAVAAVGASSIELPAVPAVGSNLRLEALAPLAAPVVVNSRPVQHSALGAESMLQWKVGRRVRLAIDKPEAAKAWLGDQSVELAGRPEIDLQQANPQ